MSAARSEPPAHARFTQMLLSLTALEGLLALFAMFQLPSEPDNAWLLGYSRARVMLGSMVAVVVIAVATLSIWALWRQANARRVAARLVGWIERGRRAHHALSLLVVLTGVCGFLILTANLPLGGGSDLLRAVYQRAGAVIWWIGLAGLQAIALLLALYLPRYRDAYRTDRGLLLREITFSALIFLALLHAAILYFNIDWFHQMYGWYFGFSRREAARLGMFVGLSVLSMLAIWAVIRFGAGRRWALPALMVVGYLLQFGFGALEGGGFETLRVRYVDRGRSRYSDVVTRAGFTLASIADYEQKYADIFHYLSTKPQGYLVFHAGVRGLHDMITGPVDEGERFESVTRFMAVLYPALAVAVLPLLYWLGRRVLPQESALAAVALYICFPGVILFTLQLDQAFFPLLFTSGVGLAVMLAERDHWLAAVATGVFLYSAVFFTFSLLPLGLFLAIYLGLVTAAAPRVEPRRWFRLGRTGLLALAGLVGTHLVIRVAFQIDLLARFPRAMAAHQAAKGFVTDLPGIAPAWMVNNAEFILWLGFPIALLVVIQLIESARAVWQWRLRGVDLLALSTLATYLALNIFGDTRAEVARLWLFLLPVLAIFAANQLKRLPFARSTNTLLLVGAQLIAAYLIFLYQFPWQ